MDNWPTEQSAIVTIIFVLVVLYRAAKYKRAMRGGTHGGWAAVTQDPATNPTLLFCSLAPDRDVVTLSALLQCQGWIYGIAREGRSRIQVTQKY